MAAKKKASGKTSDAQKTLAQMEKTTKTLQLQIKQLKKSLNAPGVPFHNTFANCSRSK